MSRERTVADDGMEAMVASLEKVLTAVDEAGIVKEADKDAKEEKVVVKKSVPDAEVKDQGDQNAKANANWKLTEAQRMKVAQGLVAMAKELLAV